YKLKDDVLLSGTKRAPQTDLPRALGDAREHDIHDHDTADHEKDRRQTNSDHEDVSRQLFKEAHDGIRADDSETVRRIPGLMTPSTQEHARFILGGCHHFGVARFYEEGK